jgi:hypothetical protein
MIAKTKRPGARAADHARLAVRLGAMLKRQIDALEAEPVDGYSEMKVKALLLLARTLQATQDAARRGKDETDARDDDGRTRDAHDIVEFRRELERRIAALDPLAADGGAAGDHGLAAAAAAG